MSVAAEPRRLNYGCGYDKREGYLNVDSDAHCEPDLVIVDNDLSVLGRGIWEEVLARDVLEHIPRAQTPHILLDWADLLTDGGELHLQTSSIEGVARQLADNPSFRNQYGWTICLFGNQAHPGDFHLTGFTEMTLTVHLLAAGFRVDRMWITDRWLLHADATKATSWTEIVSDLADLDNGAFIAAAYQRLLHREVDDVGLSHFGPILDDGIDDRRGIVKQLLASPERLFLIASLNGFEAAAPRRSQSFSQFVPAPLKPPLRAVAAGGREGLVRVQRTLGSRRRREPIL